MYLQNTLFSFPTSSYHKQKHTFQPVLIFRHLRATNNIYFRYSGFYSDTPWVLPHTSQSNTIYRLSDTAMHGLQCSHRYKNHTLRSLRISQPLLIANKKILNILISILTLATLRLTNLQHRPSTAHPLLQCTHYRRFKPEHTRQSFRIS